ncbi:MAG: nitrate ABC transporter permease, partial [Clostridia bacterium]|nr:nitrate ABC transporter permease [Clostridia bacterium]
MSICVATAVWLLVWYFAADKLNEPLLLPSPRAVLARLGEWWTTALFWQQAMRSLLRVLGGIVLGVTVAIPIAVCTALFPPVHTLLHPLIVTVKSTPVSSFIILAMLWINEGAIPVFISFLMVFPIVWTNLHTAIGGIPRPYLEMAR